MDRKLERRVVPQSGPAVGLRAAGQPPCLPGSVTRGERRLDAGKPIEPERSVVYNDNREWSAPRIKTTAKIIAPRR
jgi:hypothetical protein